jgi:hypothetical protein
MESQLSEKQKMLSVPMCGERVIRRLKSIGVTKLSDLRGRNPHVLMREINLAAGHVIWRPPMAIIALTNLIRAAEDKQPDTSPRARTGKARKSR